MVCDCKRVSPVEYMSPNLFAMHVNMVNLLETLEKVESKDRTALGKIVAIKDAFINAFAFKLDEKLEGCSDPTIKQENKYDTH